MENTSFWLISLEIFEISTFSKKNLEKMCFFEKVFSTFLKKCSIFFDDFFSGFSFRQATPVQGACGGFTFAGDLTVGVHLVLGVLRLSPG